MPSAGPEDRTAINVLKFRRRQPNPGALGVCKRVEYEERDEIGAKGGKWRRFRARAQSFVYQSHILIGKKVSTLLFQLFYGSSHLAATSANGALDQEPTMAQDGRCDGRVGMRNLALRKWPKKSSGSCASKWAK